MSKLDQGRYRLYTGIGNLLIGLFNASIGVITLGLLVWKVVFGG